MIEKWQASSQLAGSEWWHRIRVRNFYQEMKMVAHQAVGQHPNAQKRFESPHRRVEIVHLRCAKDEPPVDDP